MTEFSILWRDGVVGGIVVITIIEMDIEDLDREHLRNR